MLKVPLASGEDEKTELEWEQALLEPLVNVVAIHKLIVHDVYLEDIQREVEGGTPPMIPHSTATRDKITVSIEQRHCTVKRKRQR